MHSWQALVNKGADTQAEDAAGLRPIDLAKQLSLHPRDTADKEDLQDIVDILTEAGGVAPRDGAWALMFRPALRATHCTTRLRERAKHAPSPGRR